MGTHDGKYREDDFARECPHDWVAEDECLYCIIEKLEDKLFHKDAEIERLRARIAELEASLASKPRVIGGRVLRGDETGLDLYDTQVADLTPLKGMPLEWLILYGTQVTDLTPLKGMPLKRLDLRNTQVVDLTPLKGVPLERLWLCDTPAAKQPRPEWLPESCKVYGLEG